MKTILVDAINTFVLKGQGVHKEMWDLLEQFQEEKIIVTNVDDDQILLFGLDKMPYEVFTLKHNPEKTDPEYFRLLMKKYHFKPEDIVYIEHNKEAVKSGESLGIVSYHYDSEKRDLEALAVFLKTVL